MGIALEAEPPAREGNLSCVPGWGDEDGVVLQFILLTAFEQLLLVGLGLVYALFFMLITGVKD